MREAIEQIFDHKPETWTPDHFALFAKFKQALNAGEIRAAEPDPSQASGWRVNGWVKKGILLGFRIGGIVDMSIDSARQPFFDKSTYPVRKVTPQDGIRIVPGRSAEEKVLRRLRNLQPRGYAIPVNECGIGTLSRALVNQGLDRGFRRLHQVAAM